LFLCVCLSFFFVFVACHPDVAVTTAWYTKDVAVTTA